jgi:chromate transporter
MQHGEIEGRALADVDIAAESGPDLKPGSISETFLVALRLGLTSFGGPIAHLGYFRAEFVTRRRWLSEQEYGDLVALCQFLPGPASSQVGMAVGIKRAGLAGGLAAWLGFTLPSAVALIAFGYSVQHSTNLDSGWIHGLLLVAVAVVAQAVWGMARQFCTNRLTQTLAVLATIWALTWTGGIAEISLLVAAAAVGWRLVSPVQRPSAEAGSSSAHRRRGAGMLISFFVLLAALPILRALTGSHLIALASSFYQAGSLVFGGGHVVLPMLRTGVVDPGWVRSDQFLTGYGAAQAVPGPLFTFAAYLGTVEGPVPNGWLGGLIATVAIFLPSFLLVAGALPFWGLLRTRRDVQAALGGVNAAVVGLLLAALYDPIWTSAVKEHTDFAVVMAAFGLLAFWKRPPWTVVLFGAAAGYVLQRF